MAVGCIGGEGEINIVEEAPQIQSASSGGGTVRRGKCRRHWMGDVVVVMVKAARVVR